MIQVVASGSFDDLRSGQIRFLEEASRLGELHVLLWSDEAVRSITGKDPRFPLAERRYLVSALRYVKEVHVPPGTIRGDSLPEVEGIEPAVWVVEERDDTPERRALCKSRGMRCQVITGEDLSGFPAPAGMDAPAGGKRVIATGCFDWFHSGHVRFFEEVSGLGELHVVVGHDENIRLLKGEGHPLFPQEERRYMVQSIRHVRRAWISSGTGWMDAAPEIDRIQPDIYAVNEDGDVPEKRAFCREHGIQYMVLRRTPREGLTRRSSTNLRGF